MGLNISDFAIATLSDFQQLFALACIYLKMNGDLWKQKSGWLDDIYICDWYGVRYEKIHHMDTAQGPAYNVFSSTLAVRKLWDCDPHHEYQPEFQRIDGIYSFGNWTFSLFA
jgi:hypothetical protein